MKVTDYIVEVLSRIGVSTIFGYTGGSIADLIDSIGISSSIQFVQLYHEQSASYAANAYAQVSGKLGVAISSSGPGAINLINGIANAYYDSIPCLFITGNVHSFSKKYDDDLRQNAFQEADIVSMVSGITKYSVRILKETDIPYCLKKAIYIAFSNRMGPVLLDIPYDLQRKSIDVPANFSYSDGCIINKNCENEIKTVIDMMLNSKKPLLLVGGGAVCAKHIIREFVYKTNVPVVSSLRGLDVVENDYYYGFIGSYGNRYANLAVHNCDLLIVVGSRLDERQMGFRRKEFAPNAKIVRIDIDFGELYHHFEPDVAIQEDANAFFSQMNKYTLPKANYKWKKLLDNWKGKYASCGREASFANNFVYYIGKNLKGNKIVVADVGQNEMSTAQSITLYGEDKFLCSAGLGGMGYSLPAAIGAYFAKPDTCILSFNGDGGIQMNIQELQSVSRDHIPLKVIILNNKSLGLIRNLQDKLFCGRYYASVEGYSAPDFEKIAAAYELDYVCVNTENDFESALMALNSDNSYLIDVRLPVNQDVFPEPGDSIYQQKPYLSEIDKELIKNEIKGLEKE